MDGLLILETNLEFETQSAANTLDSQSLGFSVSQQCQQTSCLPPFDPNNPPNVVFSNIQEFFYLKTNGSAVLTIQNNGSTLTLNIDRFVVLTGALASAKVANFDPQNSLEFIVVYS